MLAATGQGHTWKVGLNHEYCLPSFASGCILSISPLSNWVAVMSFKMFIATVALLIMGIFVFQNMEVVAVNFLLWSVEASRVIIFLVIFLIGALVGWLGKSLRML